MNAHTDPRQKRWYCITEDTYLHNDFFEVVRKTGYDGIFVYPIKGGQTDINFCISDILAWLWEDKNISPVLAALQEELIEKLETSNPGADIDNLPNDEFERLLFLEFQDLYAPSYFYFFDTDRLHNAFFPPEKSETKTHEKKLLLLSVNVAAIERFYLIPSFPSLASFVWQIDSFKCNRAITPIRAASPCSATCANGIPQRQQLHLERCVICKVKELLANAGQPPPRGYGQSEKKFFCNENTHYPYNAFIRNSTDNAAENSWSNFYDVVCNHLDSAGIKYTTLEHLAISDNLIRDLSSIKSWFSAIPIFINASRKV